MRLRRWVTLAVLGSGCIAEPGALDAGGRSPVPEPASGADAVADGGRAVGGLPVDGAPPPVDAAPPVPRLVLVLDYSASMQCSLDEQCSRFDFARIEALRAAVRALSRLDPPFEIGAVVFGTHVVAVVPPGPGNAAEMEALLAQDPEGWTHYAVAIERATALLEATPPDGRFLALVSDGAPTRPGSASDAKRAALDAASAAEAAGVTRFAVNLTAVPDAREVLIATAGDPERYFEVRDAESIRAAIGEIGSRVVEGRRWRVMLTRSNIRWRNRLPLAQAGAGGMGRGREGDHRGRAAPAALSPVASAARSRRDRNR